MTLDTPAQQPLHLERILLAPIARSGDRWPTHRHKARVRRRSTTAMPAGRRPQ